MPPPKGSLGDASHILSGCCDWYCPVTSVVLLRPGGGFLSEVELNTVDAFQGREQDIVIFSSVRTSASGRIGFLSDARRLNVAMTRGKYGCYIVGRQKTLEKDTSWGGLLKRANRQRAVVRHIHTLSCITPMNS